MNQDVLNLIQKSKESIDVAEKLHKDGHFDFAVSRAYYGMFYIVQAVLLLKGKTFSSHRSIHNAFFHEFIKSGILNKSLHKTLVRGFELRQAGDYGGFASITKKQSEDIMEKSRQFIESVSDICNLNSS